MKNLLQLIGSSYIFRNLHQIYFKMTNTTYGIFSRLKTGAIFPEASQLDCYISFSAIIKYPERIKFGRGLRVGPECVLGAMGGISFGDNVRLSKGVVVETGGLNIYDTDPPYKHISKSITIESGVWVGVNSIILGGVTIGRNAVIGAGSVVTKSVPENMVFAGNPAKPIKKRG